MFGIDDLISGGMHALGSIGQGLINQQTQRETNAMSINLANTAVQRRAADLKAAGINPLLAGSQGGAQTPTLQAPTMTGIPEAAAQLTPNALSQHNAETAQKQQQVQQTAMQIEQTKAETELINKQKEALITEILAKKAGINKTNTETEWIPKSAQNAMDLNQQHIEQSRAEQANTEARTKTENLLRDPKLKQAQAQITSAQWQAKADEALPDISKAKAATDKAYAAWAKTVGEADARRADALATIAVNDLVRSGAVRDTARATEIAKLSILTSQAGQEAITTQIAQVTKTAKEQAPYIDNAVRALQGASILKDIFDFSPKGDTNIYKTWIRQ